MTKPPLRRIHDLQYADFKVFPVWKNVHGEQNKPWYHETDEVTYRPWPGRLPFGCSDPVTSVLVRTHFWLADGTRFVGCLSAPYSPTPDGWLISHLAPILFAPGKESVGIYWGSSPPRADLKAEQYRNLNRSAEQVFPIRYDVPAGLLDVEVKGILDGFYWLDTNANPRVYRSER